MPDNLHRLTFKEILPLLASTYEAGHLVPFIGAGMSRKRLAGWNDFVRNLEINAGLPVSDGPPEIRAQRAAAKIRNSTDRDTFLEFIRQALKGEKCDDLKIPAQTSALAAIYWPLAISTNYDDLFFKACRDNPEVRLEPTVVGRSAKDCKRVMSALVSPFDREMIWHIQGFLGAQNAEGDANSSEDALQLARLQGELVIGHSEYRRVANTAVHFRRCFGEVFRSRSFLFLGSSLSEDYFWNLFGEVLELCGPSSVPHFAFLSKQDKVDVRFLAEQMNITVCQYEDYSDLPQWLAELKLSITHPRARVSRWSIEIEGDSSLETVPHSPLPLPQLRSDWAVAIVVHSCPKGLFEIDREQEELHAKFKGGRFDEGKHVVSLAPGIFAVRARTGDSDEHDAVGVAIRELFTELPRDCKTLHLHLPSAGGTVPPVYGFIESVRAFGNWKREHSSSLCVIAYVGSQVRLNLTSHQIDLHELLRSSLIRFWVVVNSVNSVGPEAPNLESGSDPIRRVFYRSPDTPLRSILVEVLGEIDDEALKNWMVSVCPSPHHDGQNMPTTAEMLSGKALSDVGIVFGSVLSLDRASTSVRSAQPLRRVTSAGA